jgi:CRP/FNR family cyclic AMP-dependent transcriptional regulator
MNSKYIELIPLFAGLPQSDIEQLAARSRVRHYPAKTQIVWRGEPGDTLYVVQSGKVKVHSATENGSEVTIHILGQGACFGELSIIDESPRSADISTLEPTECLVLDGSSLREAIDRNPKLAWHLLRHLAGMVRRMSDSFETLASRDVPGRVAQLLLGLAEHHGKPWSGDPKNPKQAHAVRIDVSLSRNDIKSFVGATREHVTRIMGDLARTGCVATDPATGQIVVLDYDKLARRVQ